MNSINKKTLFFFVLLLAIAGYVVNLLITRARGADVLYRQSAIISE